MILDYNSPQALKNFLDGRQMAMQKKFGQNFLINPAARKKLIDTLDVQKDTTVWEVGPGLGCMTDELLKRGTRVTAFEIDRGFCLALDLLFSDKTGFSLVQGDVLKTWKTRLVENGLPDRFFGNLPYNIAAVIIADTIESGVRFEKAVVTVQKEVALRMCAKPAGEHYSSFSVLCQWVYEVSPLMDMSPASFWPPPHVDSRAVILKKKAEFPACRDSLIFMKILRASFSSRRKTLKNNLALFCGGSDKAELLLKAADIDPQLRAERLFVADFLRLSDLAIDVLKV